MKKSIAAAPLASLAANAAPPSLPVRLGIDLFSVRSQGWDAFQFLDFAAKQGVEVVHFSEPRFLGSLEEGHLRKVKAAADKLRLSPEVGFGCICPTSSRFKASDGPAEEQRRVGRGQAARAGGNVPGIQAQRRIHRAVLYGFVF